jgi:hypothetical protein
MGYSNLSAQINDLFSQGKNVTEIAKILKRRTDTVRYHTDPIYKEKCLEKKRDYKKKIRAAKKKKIIDRFGAKCQICFYDKCQNSLNFHHIDPSTKCFEVSDAICRLNIPDEDLEKELKKCILICANCHNEIHAGMTEIPENVKNPLTIEVVVVECSRSLEVVISADGKSAEKAENPLTTQQIMVS